MKHKKEEVFGKKPAASADEVAAAEPKPVAVPEKEMKQAKAEKEADEKEAEEKKVEDKKAEAKAAEASETLCPSEKKKLAEEAAKAEKEAKDIADTKAGEAKLAKKQEDYEKKVAAEEAKAAKEQKKVDDAKMAKKIADANDYAAEQNAEKTPSHLKPMTPAESWTANDLGGTLSLA